MKTAIVIPARYGSTRYPGKPLADIFGKSMIRRIWDIASAVEGVDQVIVATDDDRIIEHVEGFGGTAVMTDETCENGTVRVCQAIERLEGDKPDIIINLQGDAVLTPPWVIQPLVDMFKDETVQYGTIATRLTEEVYEKLKAAKAAGEVSGTTVVQDKNGDALYFSKSLIPYVRKVVGDEFPVMRHIGMYGYRYDALKKYIELPETDIENVEGLEQLRVLWHGHKMRVAEVDYRGRTHWAVDSPEDAWRAKEIIAEEGELVE